MCSYDFVIIVKIEKKASPILAIFLTGLLDLALWAFDKKYIWQTCSTIAATNSML